MNSKKKRTHLLFAKIHKNSIPFGGIPTLLIGDLAQLPPIITSCQSSNISIDTTHICGFHHEADTINNLICGFLPTPNKNTFGSLISIAIDYINNVECKPKEYDRQFRHYINLPSELIIREGSREMFLTNRLFKEEFCNGSIGVITKLRDKNHIEVVFPIDSAEINQVIVEKVLLILI
ncbi:Pif1-like helicase domain-containing protein [Rhizophagus clarus]|uniref:Pif1-like helicase domain-containing protein n=1 Tax=Rhizophagus clarus TaxID=94130 RepID=A0A8H3QSA2_9GLOM|nr:Pif1-like helicase domain-containing protein [Rhizophagus clarus]